MDINQFGKLRIAIASPEKIRKWSYGEVKLRLLIIVL